MEPFPVLFSRDAEHPELVDALRRADIPVQPYIDRDGRLAGIAPHEQDAADTFTGEASDTFGSSLATPETIPHDATFPVIYEAFSARGCETLVVTADDRPLGYVSRDGFLSMIDPIHADSFASKGETTDKLSYLVVPSLPGSVESEASALA
jgi:hypothetical protein